MYLRVSFLKQLVEAVFLFFKTNYLPRNQQLTYKQFLKQTNK